MSSEKPVNPKEKLEGMYQGRVQTRPCFLLFVEKVFTFANSIFTAQIKSADMVSIPALNGTLEDRIPGCD
jgi:hypothetical protein